MKLIRTFNRWEWPVLVLTGLGVLSLASARHGPSGPPVLPADPRAGHATVRVLRYLAALPDQSTHRIIVGHHLAHSVRWTRHGLRRWILPLVEKTGRWPGLLGTDYGNMPDEWSITATNRMLIDFWNAGSLIQLDMHPLNPWTGGESTDLQQRDLRQLLEPGNPAHDVWMQQLAVMADGLAELQKAGVVVLWRPLHEMTFQDCFWWDSGAHWPDVQPFIRLWRQMFRYFTETRGLHNLLWVYAAANTDNWRSATATWPGDDVVDMVGIDCYGDRPMIRGDGYEKLVATGKPFAITECGPDTRDGTYDDRLLLDTIVQRYPRTVYFQVWHTWRKNPVALINNRHAEELLNDPRVITRHDIHW